MSEEISQERLYTNLDDFIIEPEKDHWFNNNRTCIIRATGQKVFMKMPNKNNPEEIQAIIKEYNLLLKCSHPSIQTAIGFYHPNNSDKYCLLTPYNSHGTLSKFIVEKHGDFGKTLKYMIVTGIAAGIKYLYKNGILHGNIKPESILINDENLPIITINCTQPNQVNETNKLIYAAPELFKNEEITEKSDVFSFGLVVNEIYSEKPQLVNPTIADIIQAKSNKDFAFDKTMPKFMQKLISQCLRQDPSERPTFKQIYKELKSNAYQMQNSTLISSYIKELNTGSKLKRFFRIPHQILKLPSEEFPWDKNTEDPINWEEFNKIIPEDDSKAIFIMMIGNTQSGKSTFLRAITGNQSFFSGKGAKTTTIGLLIDGPYKRQDLLDNVFETEFKDQFEEFEISNETQIFFIDSQGIGDEHYHEMYGIVLDRIHSIFCSISSICISIPEINATYDDLQRIIKVMRRTQLMSGASTKILFLVKNSEKFDKLEDYEFDSISKFQKDFLIEYKQLHKQTSQYYLNEYMVPLPLGNCKFHYEKYIYSAWFALYNVFKQINEAKQFSQTEVRLILTSLTSNLFGQDYNKIYSEIVDYTPENANEIERYFSNSETAEVIKVCSSCFNFLTNTVSDLLQMSMTIDEDLDKLYNEMSRIICIVNDFILPFCIGEFNISLFDFWQYSIEQAADINSFLKANSKDWKKHMKLENDASKAKKPVMITAGVLSLFIPIISIPFFLGGVGGGFSLYRAIQKHKREKLRSSFQPTVYPFIWDRNMKSVKSSNYNMQRIKQIGWNNDQLFIFYEQNDNDSSLLFRSLTGFDVNYKNEEKVSHLFTNVSIKSFMERYKRYGKVHTSNLAKQRVNILYLKGYEQNEITQICSIHPKKPIFISSIAEGQKLTIHPGNDYMLHLFYISMKSYEFNFVKKKEYLKSLRSDFIISLKNEFEIENGNILPIHSKDYNFAEAGPMTNSLIKYGCRFILQDISLDLNNVNPNED